MASRHCPAEEIRPTAGNTALWEASPSPFCDEGQRGRLEEHRDTVSCSFPNKKGPPLARRALALSEQYLKIIR